MIIHNQHSDFEVCRLINKKYGKSYYFATYFFPKDLRQATYSLYAFFRLSDEIVDSQGLKKSDLVMNELQSFKNEWKLAYNTGNTDNPVLRATAFTFKKYSIPFEYSEVFLDSMIQDIDINRYTTYKDLEGYMYGSAAVVGIMMSYVIGFSDKQALMYAEKLGYAMQVTNFLRDIKEDYKERNRIYMPQQDLSRFGLTESDIAQEKMSESFINFMKFQIDRARSLYEEANKGIAMLSKRGRLAVRIASVLYGNILYEIEKQEYNIYKKRARVSFGKKIYLVIKTILKLQ